MSPGQPMFNLPNDSTVYSKTISYCPLVNLFREEFSYNYDVSRSKFRIMVLNSSFVGSVSSISIVHSALFHCVIYIFLWCSKKKMIGSNAALIVAVVTHIQSFRYGAKVYRPREPVRPKTFLAGKSDSSVSPIKFSGPHPAVVCLINKGPKALYQRLCYTRHG
jgi:hypothetical protein